MSKRGRSFKRLRFFLAVSIIALITFSLFACGSSGGGSDDVQVQALAAPTVSGVAATGAAMSGVVGLMDINGVVLTDTLDSDGSFSFNVAGLTSPFFIVAFELDASDNPILDTALITIAFGPGIANINPFTNLAVYAALSELDIDEPLDLDNPLGGLDFSEVEALLEAAIEDIQNIIQNLLANMVNPVSDPFTADHTGLDAVLDMLKIDLTVAGQVTFRDSFGGELSTVSIDGLSGVGSFEIAVKGNGRIIDLEPDYDARLILDTDTGSLTYSYRRMNFVSTTIDVSAVAGSVIVIGTGSINSNPGYEYILTIIEGSPDEIYMHITDSSDGSIYHTTEGTHSINVNDPGFTITIKSPSNDI